jgi:CTP synthase (UTP-ammonia lyase)
MGVVLRAMATRLALLGDKDLRYVTHRELDAAVALLPEWVDARWVGSDTPGARALTGFDGLWVLPGTPYRDDAAVYAAIGWALDSGTPLLGTCGGFQYAAIALARRLAGVEHAAHAEVDPDAADAVIEELACSLVGEQREVTCVPGTRLAEICGSEPFAGFHWCGYGLAERFVARLEAAGVVVSARAPDAGVEGIELPAHPFFVATLFQPQAGALAGKPLHPLIRAFVAASRGRAQDAEISRRSPLSGGLRGTSGTFRG